MALGVLAPGARVAAVLAAALLPLALAEPVGEAAPEAAAAAAAAGVGAVSSTSPAPVEHPVAASRHAIDTADKQAVLAAYRKHWVPYQSVAPGWTGSVDGCAAGAVTRQAQKATLASVNFVRAMAGLDKVTLSPDLNAEAQQAALIMAANDSLSHDPPSSWSCWTPTGADAAGASNLALSSPRITAGGTVGLYMDDGGSSNTVVGHRRWILDPSEQVLGNGLTSTTDALYVLGPRDTTNTDPDWVSWPTAGWFPTGLEPDGRWSLSSGDAGADFSHATVSVTRGHHVLTTTTYAAAAGYGLPALVFQVRGADRPGVYRVVVRGIAGAGASRHAYEVRLFKA